MQKNTLIKAVLASTLFVTSVVQAHYVTGTVAGPQTTSPDGVLEVLDTGFIAGGKNDAIQVNSNGLNVVTIDPSNINGNALGSSTGIGINILSGFATNANITIGAGSGVVTSPSKANANEAILVSNSGATITNAGTISVGTFNIASVIQIDPGVTGTIINNELNGNIINNSFEAGPSSTIADNGNQTTINNAGNIIYKGINVAIQDAITITSGTSFAAITNNAGGLISMQGGSGSAINIVSNNGNGIITNNAGATIEVTSNFSPAGNAILVGAPLNNIFNAGIIQATSAPAILINANINGLVNEGVIQASTTGIAPPVGVISVGTGVTIGNFTNTGYITAEQGSLNNAIDFSIGLTDHTIKADLLQQGGVITGNVFLAGGNGANKEVINVSGGKIVGTVFGPANGVSNIFNLSGGIVEALESQGVNDQMNLSGVALINEVTMTNPGTVNMSGGFFNLLTGENNNPNLALNITASVTLGNPATATMPATSGIVRNTTTIHIENPGTVVTANAEMLAITNQLILDDGTALHANNLLQFTGGNSLGILNHGTIYVSGNAVVDQSLGGPNSVWLNNAGVTVLGPNSVMNILGNSLDEFHDAPGSSFIVQLFGPMNGPASAGQLIVNSIFNGEVVLLEKGSFLSPQFYGFIPNNQAYNIITVFDGNNTNFITNNATFVPYPSAVVSFGLNMITTPNVGQVLQLISNRNTYQSLALGPAFGVAGTLDVLAQGAGPSDNDFYTLLSQLDQLPTRNKLVAAMDSLTPPFNWGLVEGSHIGMDSVFEGVTDRVWDVAWHHRDQGRRHGGKHPQLGMNHGDDVTPNGVWLRPIAAYVSQSERAGVDGYDLRAFGAALGLDRALSDCSTIGVAVSYTKVNVEDKNFAPKDEIIEAWMGTLYGSFDFEQGIFVDAMIAGASNDYDMHRVISVGSLLTGAKASFDGTQWGAQGDLGIALPNQPFFIAPFVRLKYVHLNIDGYTERGASDLSLTVSSQSLDEFLGGVGVRMAGDVQYWDTEWVPELTAMFAYDFTNDGENTVANFIGGGPAFTTDGVTPGPAIVDIGLALNAFVCDNGVATVKYNLELRDAFVGNSAYVQYFYNWG